MLRCTATPIVRRSSTIKRPIQTLLPRPRHRGPGAGPGPHHQPVRDLRPAM